MVSIRIAWLDSEQKESQAFSSRRCLRECKGVEVLIPRADIDDAIVHCG
jgi:hypothetical protein